MMLNCSSKDGCIITERTAKSIFFGNCLSIEEMYAQSRRTLSGEIAGKDDFDHLQIKTVQMPMSDAGYFYEALWYQFFAENPDILKEVLQYDSFFDGTSNSSQTMNSTARVFYILKKGGFAGLKCHCKDFLSRLNKKLSEQAISKPQTVSENNNVSSFQELENLARKIMKQHSSRDMVMNTARSFNIPYLVNLCNLRLQEQNEDITKESLAVELRNLRNRFEYEMNGEEI